MPRKREDEKQGRPHGAKGSVEKILIDGDLVIPDPAPHWAPIALYAWNAFLKSPVMDFCTETDLAFAWTTCNTLHSAVTGKPSAMMTQAVESMMKSALFTEQARRNARIEITRKAPEPDAVVEDNVAQFRNRRNAS
jgi:hypothetical protein